MNNEILKKRPHYYSDDPTHNELKVVFPKVHTSCLPHIGDRFMIPTFGIGTIIRIYWEPNESDGYETKDITACLNFYKEGEMHHDGNTCRISYIDLIEIKTLITNLPIG